MIYVWLLYGLFGILKHSPSREFLQFNQPSKSSTQFESINVWVQGMNNGWK